MGQSEQTCDSDRIDEYLEEQLSELQRGEFETHLSTCEYCQIELQRRAADPDIWRDAVELLSDQICDSSEASPHNVAADHQQRRSLRVLDTLAPTDDPEMLGRIGDYEVSGVVGVGGMGAVLKGFDRALRRVVAIKVMAPHLADSGSARSRFQREARAAAAITHDNIIDTYGVSEANGLPYLVMPFARGPSLQKRIDENGPLTALEVTRIGRQIASGLAAAHDQGLVHRDIKPANILLNEGVERLWITDFGVARAIDDASMTQTGVIAGTPQYMSPEQARGESVDPRSDLFSMGSVLYTACTGRPPFRSEAAYGILRRITDTEPRPIRELNPEIPEWLCHIIERLMAKDPARRFQYASEVAEIFEGCLAHHEQPTQVELPRLVDAASPQPAESLGPAVQTERPQVAISTESGRPPQEGERWYPNRRVLQVALATGAVALLALLVWQTTEPADVAGDWMGESWTSISLTTVRNASGWYSGAFTDNQGRRGALQLEWSRLQRRYNGRWKVGNGAAGSVTLRPQDGVIRGAIAIDADAATDSGMPRLRDFVWQRGLPRERVTQAAPSANPLIGQRYTGPAVQMIESPAKGRIIRWGEGIREGAPVEAGALIAEIAPDDSQLLERLNTQLDNTEHQVDASQKLVVASRKNLEACKAITDQYRAQLTAYEKASQDLTESLAAVMTAATDKVAIEKAALNELKAALEQAEVNHDRQEKLFKENIVSELKMQQSERAVTEQRARLLTAEAKVQAAENERRSVAAEQKAKEQEAQAAIDFVRVQLLKAEGDVAKAESELALVEVDLNKATKGRLEAETKLARQQRFLIRAPAGGRITQLSQSSLVKEGDVICVLQRATTFESRDAGVVPHIGSAPAEDEPTARPFGPRAVANILGRSTAALSVTDTIETATSLGQRFRRINERLPPGVTPRKHSLDDPDLQSLQATALRDRDTAISILTAERDAVQTQNRTQIAMLEASKRKVATSVEAPDSLLHHELNVLTSTSLLKRLDLLLNYYRQIGEELTTAEVDKKLADSIMKSYHEAATQRYELLSNLSKISRRKFELGATDMASLAQAEQAQSAASADLQTAKALLRHYSDTPSNKPQDTNTTASQTERQPTK